LDKARRLFGKYETLSKEKKSMHEEQKAYYRKKLEVLEDENKKCKQSRAFSEKVLNYLIPRIADLIESRNVSEDALENAY